MNTVFSLMGTGFVMWLMVECYHGCYLSTHALRERCDRRGDWRKG